jgi:hypothetical protein
MADADAMPRTMLRRTVASVLYALGEDPGVLMDEMVHTDTAPGLSVYRQAMRRGEDEKQALRALVAAGIGRNWADSGSDEATCRLGD